MADAATPSDAPGDAAIDAMPDAGSDAGSIDDQLAALDVRRISEWTTSGHWEVVYDGHLTPSDGVAGPFMWDNPIDDDWWGPALGRSDVPFQLDTDVVDGAFVPAPGFLAVDRTLPGAEGKTGSIWRRDEYLDPSFIHALYGLTLEVRVKILPRTERDAFDINYVTPTGHLNVALTGAATASPGLISTGDIFGNTNANHRALDARDFVTLRITHNPFAAGCGVYDVHLVAYADFGDALPVASSPVFEGIPCDPSFRVGTDHITIPYVQIGDNSNSPGGSAGYVLDFVRYRRDYVAPGSPLPSTHPRTPPPLPPHAAAPDADAFRWGWDANEVPTDPAFATAVTRAPDRRWSIGATTVGNVMVGGPGTSWTAAGGIVTYDSTDDQYSDVSIRQLAGLAPGGAGYAVELKLRVLPGSDDRGFTFAIMDRMGTVALTFSPGAVETVLGFKPTGIQRHEMDTTERIHAYRLIRPAGSLYAYLYVDDHPVPVIVDQHLSGETEPGGGPPGVDPFDENPYAMFGSISYWPSLRRTARVEIDAIRWSDRAEAPHRSPGR